MLKIKIGDYFDVYKEGLPTRRMIAISDSPLPGYEINYCNAMIINPVQFYCVDVNNEIDKVLGNIFD